MIDIKNLSIQFTGESLFENVNLRIGKHDKIALVGSNGTGKSTFLKLLFGIELPESGDIIKQRGISVGYLQQDLIAFNGRTLFEEVKSSIPDIDAIGRHETEIIEALNSPYLTPDDRDELLEELGGLQHEKEELDFYSVDSRIGKVLEGLGFRKNEFTRMTEEFSGGWQMRIQLAKILLSDDEMILLDEPTNHLDIDTLTWLEEYLQTYNGSLLIVSHDRHFINSVTAKTLEIFDREINFFPGNYGAYLSFKDERERQLKLLQKNREKKIKETEQFIERFRYKATKAKQVQSRIKQLEKIGAITIAEEEKKIDLRFPNPPRSGILPVEFDHVNLSYGNLEVLNDVNLQIERGDKIAIVGPNGAGKTTIAKIIAGKLTPTAGKIVYGHNTLISYYEQEVANSLNGENDLIDALEEINEDLTPGHLRAILGSFLFSGDDVFKKVKILSGGEKSRVALARLLLTESNLIILDEPTNHLDFSSKEILRKALINFDGTLIIVSHDIDFLEPVANKVLEIRNRKVKIFPGGIDYYVTKHKESDEESKKVSAGSEQRNSKKDQKRSEAEKRQQKYLQTKDLKQRLKKCEENITRMELIRISLEKELSDPYIFTNPQTSKSKNTEYGKVKNELETEYVSWTELSHKIEEIENSFTDSQ